MQQLLDSILPKQGEGRERLFDKAITGLTVVLGLVGATVGDSWGGLAGAALGLGAGLRAGGAFSEEFSPSRR